MSSTRCLRPACFIARQSQISNAPRFHLFSRARTYATVSENDNAGKSIATKPQPKDNPATNGVDFTKTNLKIPLNVAAAYLEPLRRKAPKTPEGEKKILPTCDLQLRSYSVRNLELMADFAMRAAYYLGLAASGPVPLPRRTERWTVIRSNFVHKKSQENFERVTVRRLIQIQNGHPDAVQSWLQYLQKHVYHGVGMKANYWEHEKLPTSKSNSSSKEASSSRKPPVNKTAENEVVSS